MKIYRKNYEKIFVFENFLSNEKCDYYFSKIKNLGYGTFTWDKKTIDITNDIIVTEAITFFKKKLNLNLQILQAQIQNWNISSSSPLHIHNENNRNQIKFNSLLYLNDDFEGGEFITKNGISLKPKKGMISIFNGKKVWHGVNPVRKRDRKTIIFWWKDI